METKEINILSTIDSPDALKRLHPRDLSRLAAEIRHKIIQTVAETGGHLAPNLGVVELTIAIHRVFNAPKDRIVWDVGHQAYAHKLLTGRQEKFHTLRQFGGLSGFPKRSESQYDCLDTGHSSTSISAGLGMSAAMEFKEKRDKVVVVIGDGSMTAGLAFEALNHAGHLRKDLIVILNDNEMSISPNVGALSSFLSRKLTSRPLSRLKSELEGFLKRSDMGEQIWSALKRSEDSLKSFFTPGMLFEALQFEYIGPLPGHNMDVLIETFSNIKEIKGPVLVHVLTKKGRGYLPSEAHPEMFHGVGPFDISTGKAKAKSTTAPPSYTEIFGQTICRLAKDRQEIVAITAAMTSGTGLSAFEREFPERFFDVGIAEQHAVIFAAGLALEGMRPVVAIYSTFLQRAYDQIIHDVCLSNLPVVFAIDRGGLVGDDGPTHHGVFDLSFLRAVPNLVIASPADENELQHMLYTAFECNVPFAIRYPRGNGIGVMLNWELNAMEIGKAHVMKDGRDAAIFCIGECAYVAIQAAKILEDDDIDLAVINMRFVKPLDVEIVLKYARKCELLFTFEENAMVGGFGSAVLECVADANLTARVMRIGLPDAFITHGSQKQLRRMLELDVEGVVKRIKSVIKKEQE